jgi:hypothetical protein
MAEYGSTEHLNETIEEYLLTSVLGSHSIHIDTTNFSITGEYESGFDTPK